MHSLLASLKHFNQILGILEENGNLMNALFRCGKRKTSSKKLLFGAKRELVWMKLDIIQIIVSTGSLLWAMNSLIGFLVRIEAINF